MVLKPRDDCLWVYSDENLNEIQRAGDTRFLDVYRGLKARKIENILNDNFEITGKAEILDYYNPHDVYDDYIKQMSEPSTDFSSQIELMARLFGNNNNDQIFSIPGKFESQIQEMLEPVGLYSEGVKEEVETVVDSLRSSIAGTLQNMKHIEKIREDLGTHGGRAGNLANHDNPIKEIWTLLKDSMLGITADQLFGVGSYDDEKSESTPWFLDIVACHTALNYIGYRPDKGLANKDKILGILSDGIHIAYASYCHGLISGDKKLVEKAKAIYRYKNITTQVYLAVKDQNYHE